MLAKMEGVVELKALESLVSQASKLPVSLPDAKVTPIPTQPELPSSNAATTQSCHHVWQPASVQALSMP